VKREIQYANPFVYRRENTNTASKKKLFGR